MSADLEAWLRSTCAEYRYDLRGVYRGSGSHDWPLVAGDADELEDRLARGRSPAATAQGAGRTGPTLATYIGPCEAA